MTPKLNNPSSLEWWKSFNTIFDGFVWKIFKSVRIFHKNKLMVDGGIRRFASIELQSNWIQPPFFYPLDIDFPLLVQFFFEHFFSFKYAIPRHLLEWIVITIRLLVILLFYYNHHIASNFIKSIKKSSEKNWQLKLKNFVYDTNGFYWFRFENDDDLQRLSCRRWSIQWKILHLTCR